MYTVSVCVYQITQYYVVTPIILPYDTTICMVAMVYCDKPNLSESLNFSDLS